MTTKKTTDIATAVREANAAAAKAQAEADKLTAQHAAEQAARARLADIREGIELEEARDYLLRSIRDRVPPLREARDEAREAFEQAVLTGDGSPTVTYVDWARAQARVQAEQGANGHWQKARLHERLHDTLREYCRSFNERVIRFAPASGNLRPSAEALAALNREANEFAASLGLTLDRAADYWDYAHTAHFRNAEYPGGVHLPEYGMRGEPKLDIPAYAAAVEAVLKPAIARAENEAGNAHRAALAEAIADDVAERLAEEVDA